MQRYRSPQVKLSIIRYSIAQMRKVRIPLATYILAKFILMEWFPAGFVCARNSLALK